MSKSELKPKLPRSWPATVRSAMLHVLSLAKYAAVYTRSWAADSPNVRVRLQAENNRLRQEVALLREEMRIKDARMACLPPHRRPFYPAPERMAILEMRAARGWSLEQTAESFLVCRKTIASWMKRLDEQGSEALVQLRTPVNKFPDFVRYAVQRLQTLCPSLGKKKLAEILARAGLHLGTTTVGRMRKEKPVRVEVTSPAATNLRESAERLVETYLEHSELVFEEENLYVVGPVVVNPNKVTNFKNSLHEGYSDISTSEMPYAEAIDDLGLPWVRNPSNGGYSIPLLKIGGTFNFYPDFLVWKDDIIFALDPKGGHLILEAAGRKLLDIRDENGKQKVIVRLFTEGKWESPGKRKSTEGITVWSIGPGASIKARHFGSPADAVAGALKAKGYQTAFRRSSTPRTQSPTW